MLNTTQTIGKLPTKVQRRISSGELHIHRVNDVQCITIPLEEYLNLCVDRIALKHRRKR